MHPILWEAGAVSIPSYGALLVIGFLAALVMIRLRAAAHGVDAARMTEIAAQVTLAGAVGSRLWFMLLNGRTSPLIAVWEGGHVWYGALGGGLLALGWHAWRGVNLRTLADLFLPAACLAHLFGRLGCFAAGCCWGRPTDLPWAVVFPAGSLCRAEGVAVHPTQLYEAAGEGLILLVLILLARRKRFEGEIGLAYLTLYPLLRLAVEPLRGDLERGLVFGGQLSVAQLVSFVLAASAGLLWIFKRKETRPWPSDSETSHPISRRTRLRDRSASMSGSARAGESSSPILGTTHPYARPSWERRRS